MRFHLKVSAANMFETALQAGESWSQEWQVQHFMILLFFKSFG
jgi:hypothetical protein